MSKFDEIVKNIALESEKCNYNPEIDMNWCYLPIEMRYECLKRMDFQTRCGFRGVSKAEKALVDSKKYKFKHLQIDCFRVTWNMTAIPGNGESEINIETVDRLNEKCLTAIFKYAEVENFRLYSDQMPKCKVRPILEQLQKFAPFPFKRVSLFLNRSMDFFMQTCPNLEKIDAYHDLPYKEMLSLPSLIEIKEFKFRGVIQPYFLEFLPRLVLKWIENDVEAGKSVQCLIGYPWTSPWETLKLVDTFAEQFADRIIEKTDKEVRIRMNNEKTQILMRKIGSEKGPDDHWKEKYSEYCSCKVIPIDMPKSEYEKGDGWIQAVYDENKHMENPKKFEPEDYEIWRFS